MRKAVPIAIGMTLLALVLVAGCGGAKQSTAGVTTPPPISSEARSLAASFSGTLLDGSSVSLESFKGKPLVLIFWASW